MSSDILIRIGREAKAALDYRKEILSSSTTRTDARYAPRPDYFDRMTWLQVPVQESPSCFLQTDVLFDCTRQAPYVSSVVGVVSSDNLLMEPHGDCLNPSSIRNASLRFSLSPPLLSTMPTFHEDYIMALKKFRNLQITVPGSSTSNIKQPFVSTMHDHLSFYHPLFLRMDDVRGNTTILHGATDEVQHPLMIALSPYPIANGFEQDLFGLSTPYIGQPDPHPHHPPNMPVTAEGKRRRYPIDHEYVEEFLKVDEHHFLQEPVIHSPGGTVRIEHACGELRDSLAIVDFLLGAGNDGVLVAQFLRIRLLPVSKRFISPDMNNPRLANS